MTDEAKTPWHLWVVGILSLLWNAMGCISYTMTKLKILENFEPVPPPEHIEFYYNFPAWATVFWELGVWGCLFALLALLLRKSWAVRLFGISIIGLICTTNFQWVLSDMPDSLKTAGHVAFAAVIWVVTIALFFYARQMSAAGVLR